MEELIEIKLKVTTKQLVAIAKLLAKEESQTKNTSARDEGGESGKGNN